MTLVDFDWEEFLDLTEELARRRDDVAAEPSAISRAYCAAFHKASEYFSRQGERLSLTGDDHMIVWDWFLRPDADGLSHQIGSVGLRLRRVRRTADDDPSPIPNLSAEAQNLVRLARQLVSALRGQRRAGGERTSRAGRPDVTVLLPTVRGSTANRAPQVA